MRTKHFISLVMTILFCTIISLPLLFVNLKQNKVSEIENRYLKNFPQLVDEEGHIHINQQESFENWWNDNVGFREWAIDFSSIIDLQLFGQSPNDDVHIGRQGWYFYTLDNNLDIAYGTYPLDEALLADIAKVQQQIKDVLNKSGIEYMILLAPSKASIYPEYIGYTGLTVKETPMDVVEQYLKRYTDITVINSKHAVLEAKQNGYQVFYKTDTHWNDYGAYAAYTSLANTIANTTHKSIQPLEREIHPMHKTGDFARLLGARLFLAEESADSIQIENANAVELPDDPLSEQIVSMYDGIASQGSPTLYYNPSAQGRALLFGDSFLNSSKISSWLAESYQNTALIRSRTILTDAVDLLKPDIVILEVTEREIWALVEEQLPIAQ